MPINSPVDYYQIEASLCGYTLYNSLYLLDVDLGKTLKYLTKDDKS